MSKRLVMVWFGLMALSVSSFYLAEQMTYEPIWSPAIILLLAALKAQLLCDHFMALKPLGGFWRTLLAAYGWLIFTVVGLLILLLK